MDLRVLRYFLAVCQEKNISKAAESLHIAQPSLSKQIKDLEDELGVTLFIRGHRQITLTQEGYFLRDRAQEMVNMAAQTKQIIQSSSLISGTLNIGAGQSYALKSVMQIINQLLQDRPNLHFNFYDGYADEIEAKVSDGSLDFGIIMGERPLDDFDSLVLPEKNQFYALFSKDLPLAKKDQVTPKDLIDYPIITSAQSLVATKFRNWWGNLYEKINNVANASLSYNASLLTSQGNYVQISYNHLIDTQLEKLVARPLSPAIYDPNIVIWKKNTQRSNLANKFIEELEKLSV
ncbi:MULTISPECIES: LysR family transcriptional regulator [Lactobacillus]|uniref:LysR family transcriptional regulator n=1 Tax=Lactobacillus xujianguonis TaxID=2495899 RepID=A0A437SU88_9LACO|nr:MULTISPECIES: LysR family transcriptional regulator [Lactobacillus]RVU70501.1 LysR family transcriptional regulator [Lactobacillus xujianguonis]RVU76829.1 LysR family transcriptional regulator [Lactobacillus xujianguonis]